MPGKHIQNNQLQQFKALVSSAFPAELITELVDHVAIHGDDLQFYGSFIKTEILYVFWYIY
jgi:hypothetical protein